MNIIKLIGLDKIYSKRRKDIYILKNINLSVEEGELVSIVGESGGGKSTILHIISGIDKPSNGAIYIEGKNILEMSEEEITVYRRRNIGQVFQFSNLLPMLNVKENITLPLDLDNSEIDNELFDYIIKYFKLEDKLKYYPDELSTGEIQKVLICRALIIKPSILLLDEPTRNLDKRNSEDTINLFKLFKNKYGITILMITSDLSYASLSDRIIKIEDGIIVGENSEDY